MFETLDDADVRTAGTTYLMYRGRYRHEPQRDTALTRVASTLMRHPVMGPRELFYADIFASRRTGCRSGLGMPGVRDRHSGCVSALPGRARPVRLPAAVAPRQRLVLAQARPRGAAQSIAQADLQLARVLEAAGGVDEFLAEHAVIAMADHSQAPVDDTIALQDELADLGVLGPSRSSGAPAAKSRGSPSAPPSAPRWSTRCTSPSATRCARRSSTRALAIEGSTSSCGSSATPTTPREGVISSPAHGELRFAPGGPLSDPRGVRWSVEGALAAIDASVQDGRLQTPDYPDALARVWSALTCPTSGEVLLSAAPGYEFIDWGRQAHVGGGSHGSLHASGLARRARAQRRAAARAGAGPVGDPRRRRADPPSLRGRRVGLMRRIAVLAGVLALVLGGPVAAATTRSGRGAFGPRPGLPRSRAPPPRPVKGRSRCPPPTPRRAAGGCRRTGSSRSPARFRRCRPSARNTRGHTAART